MEQREKLIELMLKCNKDNGLFDCFPDRPRYRQAAEILSDHLIANGVVVLPCRCKECVWWKYNGADDALIPPTCYGDDGEHFCAYGERKGGGE